MCKQGTAQQRKSAGKESVVQRMINLPKRKNAVKDNIGNDHGGKDNAEGMVKALSL